MTFLARNAELSTDVLSAPVTSQGVLQATMEEIALIFTKEILTKRRRHWRRLLTNNPFHLASHTRADQMLNV